MKISNKPYSACASFYDIGHNKSICFFHKILILISLGIVGLANQVFSQATLPVSASFSTVTTAGPGTMPTGFTQTGLGGYAGSLKFDTAGDLLTLNFSSAPGTLTFDLGVNNSFPGTIPATATFIVEESANGTSWTTAGSYTNSAGGTKTISVLSSSSRYVRWNFSVKPSGTNIALKNIALASGVASSAPTITGISPNAALDGATVTITGTNLTSATSVTFTTAGGPVAASVSSNSDTQVVCLVPSGTITGIVTVTTANGSATTSFRSIHAVALPYGPETFDTNQGAWFTFDSAGTKNWSWVSSTLGSGGTTAPANGAMEMNGFGSDVAANDWLILGPFDMSTLTDPVVQFSTLGRFITTAGTAEMALKVSTNYPGVGDPSASSWTDITFTKPASELVKTPSGQVALTGAAGQSSVYIAFRYTAGGTTNGTTALWQVDDVEVYNRTLPAISVTAPGSLNEGGTAQFGTVTIPTALAEDITITITSADAAEIQLDGDGLGLAATSTVLIPAGFTSGNFIVQALTDNLVDGNKSVQITAEASGYIFGQAFVQSVDADYLAPSVVINKIINNGSNDVVELLVVGDGNPGSTVDLQGMIIKDYSSSAANDGGGSFTFATSSTWSAVKAGTLIVLTNQTSGTEDLDGADFVIRANLKNTALFAEAGAFDIGGTELVEIKAAGSAIAGHAGAIHSVAFGTTSAAQVVAAPRPKLVSGNSGNFQVATNASGNLADFNGSGLTLLGAAPTTGIPSNAGNAAFISGLRGVQSISVTVAAASAIVDENAGEQTDAITISLSSAAIADVTVNLSASPSGAISLPSSVLIGAGQSSATVSFTPVDDGVVAGNKDVTITATASGYETGSNGLTVVDTQFVPPSVVINEIANSTPDSVELLTISNNLNMVGMIFKDFSTNMGGDSGGKVVFKDVPLWQSVPAGTLIVLTADANATEDTDVSDGVVTVKLSNSTLFTITAGFDISTTDMVTIKAAGSGTAGVTGAIHTFATGIAGSYFKLANGAKLIGSGSVLSAENATSTLADYNGTGATGQASTLGLANNSTNQAFIDALRASVPPVVSGTLTLSGTVGTAITPYQIMTSGSPTSYSSGTLPAGLTLDTGTGIISGTPTAAQAATDVQISATNTGGTGSANLTITVNKATPTINTSPTASNITEGAALSASVLTGGSASVAGTFDWTSPSTVPPLGTAGYSVTFTPTDAANYNTATTTVNVTVDSADYLFSTWSGGAPITSPLLVKFAIGGAASPTDASETPVTAVEGGNLTLTAIVRTNSSQLTVVGEAVSELTGTWSTTGVTSTTVSVDQTGVPEGCERRKFSVSLGTGSKKFLRLSASLPQ